MSKQPRHLKSPETLADAERAASALRIDVERDAAKTRADAERVAEDVEADLVTAAKDNRTFPLAVRVLGVLLILSGISNVALHTLLVVFANAQTIIGQALEEYSTVTIVLAVTYLVILAANAVAQVVLGIRLLRGKHRGVALAAKLMALLQAAAIVCSVMLYGLSTEIYGSVVSIVLLAVLQTYADPTLRQERDAARRSKELQDRDAQEAGTLGRDVTGKGYIELDFFNIFWIFVVCCVIGLVLEVIWHMTVVDPGVYEDRAGLLYGPFSPIYGFGGALVTIFLNRFWKSNPVVVFLAAGVIGATFEYCVSWWMEFSFGITAWDYSGTFLNINGRTNFMFFCMWGALGIVWLRFILPQLLKLINRIPWNWRYSLTAVCAALMLVDCGLTVAALDCWYQREAGTMATKEQSAIDTFCNESYDDAFMTARFQTMSIDPDSATRLD